MTAQKFYNRNLLIALAILILTTASGIINDAYGWSNSLAMSGFFATLSLWLAYHI
jgi:hypothetical protein